MFFSISLLKKFNFGKKKQLFVYKRSQNIPRKFLQKIAIYISRGLYPTPYIFRLKVKPLKFKFGMFSFTRKPFAIPEKKNGKKR